MLKFPALLLKKDVENSKNTEIPWAIQNKECSSFCSKEKFFVANWRAVASTSTFVF